MKNTLGAVLLNLEIAADPALSSGPALEAAIDALAEAKRLRQQLTELGI